MELWIRSQENYEADITPRLIKVNNLALDYEGENDSYYIVVNEGIEIAYYHSEKRALEVLDEIQEAQLGNYHYRCPSNVKVSNNENTIVYEMPKK